MSQEQQDWIETYEYVRGVQAAGPDELQQVGVLKVGHRDARRVLILLGGREGAAGVFKHAGRTLASADNNLQVWAVDRREQNLADLTGFGESVEQATEYYLGGHYQDQDQAKADYAADWGLEVLLEDLRRIVLEASDGGRREVVLGGVSVGGSEALLYAAWDFNGAPGYSDLAGLAIVDGGVLNAYSGAGMEFELPMEAAQGWLAAIRSGAVFEDFTSTTTGLGDRPESAALWYQLAAQHALVDPNGPSVLANKVPEAFRVNGTVTNAGLFGRLVDAAQAHPSYSVQAGHLNDDGAWVDAGPTRLQTVAEAFAGPRPGAWTWYTLNRVMLDLVAAIDFKETELTRFLGLRVAHGADINVPLYVFQSGLTNGTTGQAAASVTAASKIPELSLFSDTALTHQDLVYAQWEDNRFLQTLNQFLRTLPQRAN
jgi:hypothetical protein